MKTKLYLLSGNGSSAEWWRSSLPYFKQFQPIAIELPGFGSNQARKPKDLDGYARDLLSQCQAGNAIVACGISALIVLRAATIRPSYFQTIVLLSPIGAFLWQRRLAKLLSTRLGASIARLVLAYFPLLLKSLYSTKAWSRQQRQNYAKAYRRCSAFTHLCRIIHPSNALQLFDTLQEKVHIVWGDQDKIADSRHAAAWESILGRCRLSYTFIDDWGHYPYIENAQQFSLQIEKIIGSNPKENCSVENAHNKGGRLLLAQRGGIKTPLLWLANRDNLPQLLETLPRHKIFTWAIRGASDDEDQLQQSKAGQSPSYIAIPSERIEHYANLVLHRCQQVILQEYVEVKISGVAFIRHLGVDLEWMESRSKVVTDGRSTPYRLRFNTLYDALSTQCEPLNRYQLNIPQCIEFLREVSRTFHYMPIDIEWGWNGRHFYLFQSRPITTFQWQRLLSSANIDELLATQPSMIMENTQRLASRSIPQIYALWDQRVLEDNEAFSDTFDDASYLNLDLYIACLKRWGLPSRLLDHYVGAQTPYFKMNIKRFLYSTPIFFRMLLNSRRYSRNIEDSLKGFEADLDDIASNQTYCDWERLQSWFLRLYVFVVQTNLALNAAIVSSLGDWRNRRVTAYSTFHGKNRVDFETDPGSERPFLIDAKYLKIPPTRRIAIVDLLFDRCLLPGNQSFYIEQRELFRDNYTRLYYRLHFLIRKHDTSGILFSPYLNQRNRSGSFWQHSGAALNNSPKQSDFNEDFTLIYPGQVDGIVNQDILIVDRLDPGRFKYYQGFKAVIARGGGYLSHAAILLRESKIPSAFIPSLPNLSAGTRLIFENGRIQYQAISD